MNNFFLLIAFFMCAVTICAEPIYHFENKHQTQLYQELTQTTRCLVCQNQNIADSNSRFSMALKSKLAQMIKEGKSKQAIKRVLSHHYGEKVLFEPAKDWRTAFLWYGPFTFLLCIPLIRFWMRRGS